ncbi:MAG: hypothetical protein KJ017_01415 [Alphaproteobacteria bacterium]|nr:hypothetical protein [Alphaproteobacteria bacterium]
MMSKKKIITLFLACLSGFLLYTGQAKAICACEQAAPEVQEAAADAIFIGKTIGPTEAAGNGIWTTLVVESMKKETEAAKIIMAATVMPGEQRVRIAQRLSNCNFVFEADKTYLVYAIIAQSEKGVGYLSTGQCAGTKEITEEPQAQEDLPEQKSEEQTENKGQ